MTVALDEELSTAKIIAEASKLVKDVEISDLPTEDTKDSETDSQQQVSVISDILLLRMLCMCHVLSAWIEHHSKFWWFFLADTKAGVCDQRIWK